MAPIGRPPEDREARKRYNELKRTPTPYQKGLDEQKERRAKARAEQRVKNAEAKAKEKRERQQKNARKNYRRSREAIEKDSALRFYEGWSIQELRTDCKDHGISDYRKDWMKMSRDQLAVWLYTHKGRDHRAFYEGRRACTK